jgi:hypothetical protein
LTRLQEANRRRTLGVVFVGFPKTGNTWLRFMLGCYVQETRGLDGPPLFDEFDRLGRARRYEGLPGMTFTHAPLEWETQGAGALDASNVIEPFTGRRVVLVVRHPLDSLVSLWHQMRTRSQSRYEGDLVTFLDSDVFGLAKLLRFYALWEDAHRAGFPLLLVRYEDMSSDAGRELRRVLDFVGESDVDVDAVARAAVRASFDAMKDMEQTGAEPRYKSSGLGIFATGDRADPNAFHVRRGVVGGYRDELGFEDALRHERRIEAEMSAWYGYELVRNSSSPAHA